MEKTFLDGEYIVTHSTKSPKLVEPTITDKHIAVLQKFLLKDRWNEQGGFPQLNKNSEWRFVDSQLGTPKEAGLLFELAGIIPDNIVSRGSCKTCRFSNNGFEKGYEMPCLKCSRPYHSYWSANEAN